MNYGVAGANVGPGHYPSYPVAGVSHCGPGLVGGAFSNLGIILVLFILLVIISRACLF